MLQNACESKGSVFLRISVICGGNLLIRSEKCVLLDDIRSEKCNKSCVFAWKNVFLH